MEQAIQNEVVSMPRIGDKAPSFKAVTTQGEINFLAITQVNGQSFLATRQTLLLFVLLNL